MSKRPLPEDQEQAAPNKRPRLDSEIKELAREYKDMKKKEESIALERKKGNDESNVSVFRRYLKWKKWVKQQEKDLSGGRAAFGHLVRDEVLCEKVLTAARSKKDKNKSTDPAIQKIAGDYEYMCHKEKYESEAYDFHRYLKWKKWVKQQEKELSHGPFAHLVCDEELCAKVLAAARNLK